MIERREKKHSLWHREEVYDPRTLFASVQETWVLWLGDQRKCPLGRGSIATGTGKATHPPSLRPDYLRSTYLIPGMLWSSVTSANSESGKQYGFCFSLSPRILFKEALFPEVLCTWVFLNTIGCLYLFTIQDSRTHRPPESGVWSSQGFLRCAEAQKLPSQGHRRKWLWEQKQKPESLLSQTKQSTPLQMCKSLCLSLNAIQ